jgi:ATP-binding cassette subfamily D (ALD) long-chain fatty acid import protein
MHTFSKPLDSYSWLKKHKLLSSGLFAFILIGLYQTKQQYHQTASQKRNEKQQDVSHLFPIIDMQKKVGVNKEFRRQLTSIATILFPNWHTKEALLLVLHSVFLILRTYLSVVVARLDGRIVRDLVISDVSVLIQIILIHS